MSVVLALAGSTALALGISAGCTALVLGAVPTRAR